MGCRRKNTGALFGGLDVRGGVSRVQGLKKAEEAGGLADAAELDAEGLHLDEQVLHVDDLVPDQRLEEHAHQTHQAVLGDRDTLHTHTRTYTLDMLSTHSCWAVHRWQTDGHPPTRLPS